MAAVRGVPVAVVQVVDVVAVPDGEVPATGPVLVAVRLARLVRRGRPSPPRSNGWCRRRHHARAAPAGAVATNPASAMSTIVGPGAVSAWKLVTTPASEATTPIPIASANVVRKLRVSCCAVATGTTISALTSSSPTVRMDTVTVTAASTAISRPYARDRHPADPGVLLVLAHGEQLRPEADSEHQHDRRRARDDAQVVVGHGGDGAEQVRVQRRGRLAGEPDDQHAAGDAAVEEQGQRHVAAGARVRPQQLDDAPRRRGRDDTAVTSGARPGQQADGDTGERDVADAVAEQRQPRCTR